MTMEKGNEKETYPVAPRGGANLSRDGPR